MLALSPSMGWPIELEVDYSICHNNYNLLISSSEYSFLPHHQFSSSPPRPKVVEVERCKVPSPDPTMVKKLNHNASERNRRKKISSLYYSLRSLLPVADQTKKMSIPATISRVLKYIPELQQQVKGLTKKKEEFLLRISRQGDAVIQKSQKKNVHPNSFFVVSTKNVSFNEASIQISFNEVHQRIIPLSETLFCLEDYGLVLLNASSSESFGGRIFYNLHFQVEKSQRLESDVLCQKLLSIYDQKKPRRF